MFRFIIIAFILVGCASKPDGKFDYNPKAAEANAELGKSYLQRGDYEVAMKKLTRALKYDPKSANAHHYIAELYRRLDRPEDADEHYRRAISYSVNNSALFNNYGVYLCGEKRIDEALLQFERVLKNPVYRFPELVYENIGLCMMSNGMMKEAEYNLRKALSINPELPNSLYELAGISLQRDRLFSARAFMNRYLDANEASAAALWLAVEIETKLKDDKAVKGFGKQLLDKFPLSEEAEKYQRLKN